MEIKQIPFHWTKTKTMEHLPFSGGGKGTLILTIGCFIVAKITQFVGLIGLSDAAYVVTILAGLSTIFLNYHRYKTKK